MTKNILNEDPIIYSIDNFLTKEECDYFIENSKDKIKQALVSSNNEGVVSDGRSGKNHWIPHNETLISKEIGDRISKEVGIALENAEAFQVIYYDVNQEYRKHYDSWDFDNSEKSIRNMRYGGPRMITALVYLNNVEEGGGTKFTKLDKDVSPEIGKLLVFHNVYSGKNIKHELSEHAGMPVIKGEKWAFNLWFREESRSKLYKYPNIKSDTVLLDITDPSPLKIKTESMFFNEKDFISLNTEQISLGDSNKKSIWLNNNSEGKIIDNLSKLMSIDKKFFENICITKYKKGFAHNFHLDAYDLNTDIGKKNTENRGQRLLTATGFLSDVMVSFNKLNKIIHCKKGDVLYYKNCYNESDVRDCDLNKSYAPMNHDEEMLIFNVYAREYSESNKKTKLIVKNTSSDIVENKLEKPALDYSDITDSFYKDFLSVNKEFKINNKVSREYIKTTLSVIDKYKQDGISFLNNNNLEQNYYIDEFTPVKVENVVSSEIHNIIDNYFKHNIKNGVYPFGDRQSDRYKIIDETLTRLLHVEFLPLINKIVGKEMKPTYTYLSCYVKGSDLPAHTDRPECEYTCSYIIGKPKDTTWNIYVHKVKQPVKYKGRYAKFDNGDPGYTPPKEECIAVDCEENGLMIFNGTDHIHYREPLEHEYYNVALLHYCSE